MQEAAENLSKAAEEEENAAAIIALTGGNDGGVPGGLSLAQRQMLQAAALLAQVSILRTTAHPL